MGVVVRAVEKLNQTIDGQTTQKVENQTLLQCCALCWAQSKAAQSRLRQQLNSSFYNSFIDSSVFQ